MLVFSVLHNSVVRRRRCVQDSIARVAVVAVVVVVLVVAAATGHCGRSVLALLWYRVGADSFALLVPQPDTATKEPQPQKDQRWPDRAIPMLSVPAVSSCLYSGYLVE